MSTEDNKAIVLRFFEEALNDFHVTIEDLVVEGDQVGALYLAWDQHR
jgi:predicted ester cyclase